ncbi:MAG: hypothetical protein O7B35_16825 [Deltaproteobacteria bacterium]|nr:hypothetical protein [Deltaproteobacteria bacterium]
MSKERRLFDRQLFERVAGPLKILNQRLAVGRCSSCGTSDSLFIDLETGAWRCGRLPSTIKDQSGAEKEQVKEGNR